MATGQIDLPVGGALQPDGSTNNAAPGLQRVKSSASAPSVHFLQLLFDASTDEMVYWQTRMPPDYASAPVMKVQYKMASGTSGSVRFEGRVAATTPGDSTDLDAKALATTNSAGDVVPSTAGYVKEVSISLTNADSLAPGDQVFFSLRRDADGTTGTDDASGDCEVVTVAVEYTTL